MEIVAIFIRVRSDDSLTFLFEDLPVATLSDHMILTRSSGRGQGSTTAM